jgi:hypothetical protein
LGLSGEEDGVDKESNEEAPWHNLSMTAFTMAGEEKVRQHGQPRKLKTT